MVLYYERGWPGPFVTDESGTITLRDIGANTKLLLQARDDRFAPQWIRVTTPRAESTEPITVSLAPHRLLEGRIIAEDTKQPLANATVFVENPDEAPYGFNARFSAIWLLPVALWASPKPGYPDGVQTFAPAVVTAILLAALLWPGWWRRPARAAVSA